MFYLNMMVLYVYVHTTTRFDIIPIVENSSYTYWKRLKCVQ